MSAQGKKTSRKAAKPPTETAASRFAYLSTKTWMLLVALAAIALYLPTLGYDFVYDSATQVGSDSFIHQPRHLLDVLTLRVLGMDVLDFNRPVNLFTLLVDSLLWGKNPAGYRLTSLLLHGATAALLFRWLRNLTGTLWPALVAALFFAVHPLHCETVVEVGYREDLLATLFLLAGLNAAAAFQPGEKGKTWLPAILTVASFFLSAASKESGIVGPVLLAAFWWFFRREKPQTQRAWLLLIATTTVAVGVFFALRFALEPRPSLIFDTPPKAIAPMGVEWLFVQVRIWAAELLRIVWPADLCVDYGPYNLRFIEGAWAFIAILMLVITQAVLSIWNRKIALVSVLFWGALAPVSNLIPIYRPMADRYLYMPMVAVALLLAVALAAAGSFAARTFTAVGALAVLVVLTVVTLHQQTQWKDAATLWQTTARQNPNSFNAWLGRGYACLDRGEPAQAVEYFQQASELARGQLAEPFAAIALAHDALGQPRLAAEALAHATKLDSRYARPDTLVRALLFPTYQAKRLEIIALRARLP